MTRLFTSLSVAAMALAGLTLSAEDFNSMMKVTQATWPEKHHIGVICNYQANEAQVRSLAAAAGEKALITVVDARHFDQANIAAILLVNRKADYVVLMPNDLKFRDGSFGATIALHQLAQRGVPAIGTTPAALRQGAVFTIGDGTNGELLVTDKVIGTVSVILPDRSAPLRQANLIFRQEGMATIAVHTMD